MDLDIGPAQLVLGRGREVDEDLVRTPRFAQFDLQHVAFSVHLFLHWLRTFRLRGGAERAGREEQANGGENPDSHFKYRSENPSDGPGSGGVTDS